MARNLRLTMSLLFRFFFSLSLYFNAISRTLNRRWLITQLIESLFIKQQDKTERIIEFYQEKKNNFSK